MQCAGGEPCRSWRAGLRKDSLIRPLYGDRFRCIGPACEDSCCTGWRVPVDEASYRKYQQAPEGPLKLLIDSSMEVKAGHAPGREHATVRMLPSGDCPFLTEKHLCRIQEEWGEESLCTTCKTYPRTVHVIDKLEDKSLTMSCPEAARLVLLDPELVDLNPLRGPSITWNDQAAPQTALSNFFWVIRNFSVRLVLNRNYALWQRLILLGVFSRRLEAIQNGKLARSFGKVLQDFSNALHAPSLRCEMETIRPDPEVQLILLFQFLDLGAQNMIRSTSRSREVLEAFIDGIGWQPGARAADCSGPYQTAYRDFYQPFMQKHPHILENYLVNHIFRSRFPMGNAASVPAGMLEIEKTYELLIIQFALMKGMLIGVAGHFRDQFGTDHAVQVIQTVARNFEHSTQFLTNARELLKARNMDSAQGMTLLVRN